MFQISSYFFKLAHKNETSDLDKNIRSVGNEAVCMRVSSAAQEFFGAEALVQRNVFLNSFSRRSYRSAEEEAATSNGSRNGAFAAIFWLR